MNWSCTFCGNHTLVLCMTYVSSKNGKNIWRFSCVCILFLFAACTCICTGLHLGFLSGGGEYWQRTNKGGAWAWPNIFRIHFTHIVVTTLYHLEAVQCIVLHSTCMMYIHSLGNTCYVFNTKGWVWEGDVPPPPLMWTVKLTIIYVKMSKTVCIGQLLYQSGENFLYCVYKWWLFSKGGRLSAPLLCPSPQMKPCMYVWWPFPNIDVTWWSTLNNQTWQIKLMYFMQVESPTQQADASIDALYSLVVSVKSSQDIHEVYINAQFHYTALKVK